MECKKVEMANKSYITNWVRKKINGGKLKEKVGWYRIF